MQYSTKLRAMADYLDDHPEVAEHLSNRYERPFSWITTENWEAFTDLVGTLGAYEKSAHDGYLEARVTPQVDGEDLFTIRVSVSGVCEQVPKVDFEGKPVMKPVVKSRYVTEETGEMEPEVEYKCPEIWR